jgi:uncharacterized protein YkwD
MKPTVKVQITAFCALALALGSSASCRAADGSYQLVDATTSQPAGIESDPGGAAQVMANGEISAATGEALRDDQLLPAALALLEAVNILRTLEGGAPLAPSASLTGLAFERAGDMVEGRYLAHVDPNGVYPSARELLAAGGYETAVAELVLASQDELGRLPQVAVARWTDSVDNRTALLDPVYRYAGVGLLSDGAWWKIVLLLSASEPDA